MPGEWDIRIFDTVTQKRISLPTSIIHRARFEILASGGFGNGSVELIAPWEKYHISGGSRADIYIRGKLAFRGYIHLPEHQINTPESKVFGIYGTLVIGNSIAVDYRYAFGGDVDVSQMATLLAGDYLPSSTFPTTDIQPVGVVTRILDGYGKNFNQCISALANISPGSVVWGYDIDVNGNNRFYFRPAATKSNVRAITPGKNIHAAAVPYDTSGIVNKVHIIGGKAQQPNLLQNAAFNTQASPDETHGNLLFDSSFELGLETNATYWALGGGGSIKTVNDPGGGTPGARTGSAWVSLDHLNEYVTQKVYVNASRLFTMSAWVRRGTPGTPSKFDMYLDLRTASDTTIGYVYAFQGVDPGIGGPGGAPNFDGNPANYQLFTATVDATYYAGGVDHVYFSVVGGSGTGNNDGVFIDDAALVYQYSGSNQTVQNGWREYHSYTPVPFINWVYKSGADAAYGEVNGPFRSPRMVAIEGGPPTVAPANYTEIRSESWARVQLNSWRIYTVIFFVKTTNNAQFQVTIGSSVYDSSGNLLASYESATFSNTLTNGSWTTLIYSFPSGKSQTTADVWIRNRSNQRIYIGGAMLVEGIAPAEVINDGNFWEGSSYEKVYSVTDSDISPINYSSAGVSYDHPTILYDTTSLTSGTVLTPAAQSSITNYGIKSKFERNDMVFNKATAIAFATGYLNQNAVPKIHASAELLDFNEPLFDFGSMVKLNNIKNAPDPLNLVRIEIDISRTIQCRLELSNEFPTLALLTLAYAKAQQLLRGYGAQSYSTPSSVQNSGGALPTGNATDANVVHLTGNPEVISSQKTFTPPTVGTVEVIHKALSGQTADHEQWQDPTGVVLSKVNSAGVAQFAGYNSADGTAGQTVTINYTQGGYTGGIGSRVADVVGTPTVGESPTGGSWPATGSYNFAVCWETTDGYRTRAYFWSQAVNYLNSVISVTAPGGTWTTGVANYCVFVQGAAGSPFTCFLSGKISTPGSTLNVTGPGASTDMAPQVNATPLSKNTGATTSGPVYGMANHSIAVKNGIVTSTT